MLKGYARVSTDGQDVAMQVQALKAAGVRQVATETRSGALDLPGLQKLVAQLRPGDVLVVWKVDRLARSLRGLLELAERVRLAGASLRSLTEPIDTGSPVGKAFFQLLGVFSELERNLIKERCSAGRQAARERGVRFGRRPSWDCDAVHEAAARGMTAPEAARAFGVDARSIRKAARYRGLTLTPVAARRGLGEK